MSGTLTVKSPIVGYNYNKAGGNAAAFIFDKPGSNWTGIGAHTTGSTIWFGACDGSGNWIDDFKQVWDFNGTIKQQGVAVSLGGHTHDGLYIKKTSYDWYYEVSDHGAWCLGKFCIYDSTIIIDIKAGNGVNNVGTLVINSWNKGTNNGQVYAYVHGDANNDLTDRIKIYNHINPDSLVEVYYNGSNYTKMFVHIQASNLMCRTDFGGPEYASLYSDIGLKISSIPGEATITPTNVLLSSTSTFSLNTTGNAATATYASSAGSVSWNNITGKPDSYIPSSHNHDTVYVKKTDPGIITGSDNAVIAFNGGNNTEETGIVLKRKGTTKAWIGYHDTYGVYLYNSARSKYLNYKDDGSLLFEGNTIIHAGNYTSYCATSGHNHDSLYLKLSGGNLTGAFGLKSESETDWNITQGENKIRSLVTTSSTIANGAPGRFHSAYSFMTGYCGFQLSVYGGTGDNDLYFRHCGDSSPYWGNWYKIYHSGNLPAYPTKSSWNYDDTYLKLNGGTLTGNLTATNSYIKAGGNGLQYPIRITRAYNDSVDFLIGSASSEAGSSGALNMRISNNSSGGGGEVYIDLLSGGGGVNVYPSLTIQGSSVATSSDLGNYVAKSGSTMTGALRVNHHIFAYNYGHAGSSAPAIIFDKPGSHYTGIGCHSTSDTIYFGAATLSSNNEAIWVDSYKQKWVFNGTLTADSIIKSGGTSSQFLKADGSVDSNTYSTTSHNHDSSYVPKLSYEYNIERNFGQYGILLIGRFGMYDSNVTIYLDSTTSYAQHAVIVLATQNINDSGGGLIDFRTFGDSINSITPNIYLHYPSDSRYIEIYYVPAGWSKNLIHIKCSGLYGIQDVNTYLESLPDKNYIHPTNTLVQLANSEIDNIMV